MSERYVQDFSYPIHLIPALPAGSYYTVYYPTPQDEITAAAEMLVCKKMPSEFIRCFGAAPDARQKAEAFAKEMKGRVVVEEIK